MKTLRYELSQEPCGTVATITFDQPDSPVNTMCADWQDDMAAVAGQAARDREQLAGIILASAKRTFFAGADLKSVMRLTAADAPAVYAGIERLKQAFRTLETLWAFPWSPASTAAPWAAAGSWPWWRSIASPSTTPASSWACPS